MLFYSIRHLTKFVYSKAVSESVMEVRMHPRSDSNQRCLTFSLSVSPRCRVFSYRDHLSNNVHHFDIPGQHGQLVVIAESLVEHQPLAEIPSFLAPDAWRELDALVCEGDYWEMLLPSEFTEPTPALDELARELNVVRRDDPMMLLRELNHRLYDYFSYSPRTTRVDSPIDEALHSRQGVCQDFAHIMIAICRDWGLPARYVSGYLFTDRAQKHDRSDPDASHAWVEVFLPSLRWVGLDPTNDIPAGERHVQVAVGRDYNDVPPSRGVFKGESESQLAVGVSVRRARAAVAEPEFLRMAKPAFAAGSPRRRTSLIGLADQQRHHQQQQQQQ
jgi:transglutaminase-like putative cysteine protease